MAYYLTQNELYHFGIKGQKWGVRNFENYDGTLTPEGRERYGYKNLKAQYKKKVKDANSEYIKSNKNILTEKENNKRLEILNKPEYLRSSKESKLLAEYNNRLVMGKINNLLERNSAIKEAKKEFKDSKEYKIHKAMVIVERQ